MLKGKAAKSLHANTGHGGNDNFFFLIIGFGNRLQTLGQRYDDALYPTVFYQQICTVADNQIRDVLLPGPVDQ